MREHDRLGAAFGGGGEQFERAAAVGPGAVAQMAKRGEYGIGEREHARVYPNARSGDGEPQARRTRVGGGEWRAPTVRAARAVRHCGKFPNAPVAPLRAGRQCKPLWLLQWCRTF